DGTGSGQWGGAADGLAREIQAVIAERVGQFGIVIDDVSLQEIRLPDAVIAQCVEACKSYYLPLLAQRKAAVRRAELGTDVDLLGADAVAAREVAAVAPAYALGDFLNEFLRDRGAGSAKAARAALGAAAAAQIAGQLPAAATPDGSAN
ncbi:MAG TPA: hypothetical protein VEA69_18960, partial [Tepidisphaeraceae bacterium]|nr:hypothetical protein [Tepidisphaeraceae bacterium]